MKSKSLVLIVALLISVQVVPANSEMMEWDASSGMQPNEFCSQWYWRVVGVPGVLMCDGLMTTYTHSVDEMCYWKEFGSNIAFPDTVELEFGVRYMSGTVGAPTGRSNVGVSCSLENGHYAVLMIGDGSVWLARGGYPSEQIQLRNTPTSDDVHVYRIIVVGSENSVAVYKDDLLLLEHTLLSSATPSTIWFGDGTSHISGVAEWTFFRHNASTASCENFQDYSCDNLWNLQWFGCDSTGSNEFFLERDGTPVCGHSNCPGPPPLCWGEPLTVDAHGGDGVQWCTGRNGSLELWYGRDYQFYGDTYFFVTELTNLEIPIEENLGAIWVNDELVYDPFVSDDRLSFQTDFVPGWNHFEFTAYNQNGEAWFRLPFGFSSRVVAMASDTLHCAVSGVPGRGVASSWLYDARPNPFNPQTTIAFDLPEEQAVSLRVYDVSGHLVDVIIDNEFAAQGRNEVVWRGRDMAGRVVSAGVYFYRLEAGSYSETKRMVLIK